MMGEHERAQESPYSNPLTRDEEHDALVKEIVELKTKLSQFHTDREYQVHMVKGLDTQIQSIERDRTSLRLDNTALRTELAQLRASFDLLRGNFKEAQERWQKKRTELGDHISWLQKERDLRGNRIQQMTTLVGKQSRIIKSQTARLEELQQSQQPQPFWIVSSGQEGYMVMGPDKTTWFKWEPTEYHGIRCLETPEQALGLCQHICTLLLKAWKEGKAD